MRFPAIFRRSARVAEAVAPAFVAEPPRSAESACAPAPPPPARAALRQLDPRPGFAAPGLDLTVSTADTMLDDDTHYVSVGRSAIAAIDRALDGRDPGRILDLPCGFGRVTRALRLRFPNAAITVSDLDRDGVDFSAAQFRARAAYSVRNLAELDLGETYDLIWVGSLMTHLPAAQTRHMIAALARHLAPDGVLLISLQGPSIIPQLRQPGYGLTKDLALMVIGEFERTGYGYADYPGHDAAAYGVSLTNDHYGISLTHEPWMRDALHASGLRLVTYTERDWDDHHDIVVAQHD